MLASGGEFKMGCVYICIYICMCVYICMYVCDDEKLA